MRPFGVVEVDPLTDNPLSLEAVRQLDGSYAHFWVKGGHIEWCADSGNTPPLTGELTV